MNDMIPDIVLYVFKEFEDFEFGVEFFQGVQAQFVSLEPMQKHNVSFYSPKRRQFTVN